MGTRGGPRFAKIHFLEGLPISKVTILFWEIKRYGFEFIFLVTLTIQHRLPVICLTFDFFHIRDLAAI